MEVPTLTPEQQAADEAELKRKVAAVWLRKLIETSAPPALFAEEIKKITPRILDLLVKIEKHDHMVNAETYICPVCSAKSYLNLTNRRCPKCNEEGMVLRQNSTNHDFFLGCKRFPSCNGTRSLRTALKEANRDIEAEAEKRRQRKIHASATDILRPGEELRRINL